MIEVKKAAIAEEWKAFKIYGDSIINENNERIAELKLKIKKTGKRLEKQSMSSMKKALML